MSPTDLYSPSFHVLRSVGDHPRLTFITFNKTLVANRGGQRAKGPRSGAAKLTSTRSVRGD